LRPDLQQMILGLVMHDAGWPVCTEMARQYCRCDHAAADHRPAVVTRETALFCLDRLAEPCRRSVEMV
jgi:hypothetical protein